MGLEGTVLVARERPQGGHGVYITFIPLARLHVGEGVFLPGGGVFQQGVEHFGGLGPGHAVVRADFVLVALQVDHVLLGVEHRQVYRLPGGGLRLGGGGQAPQGPLHPQGQGEEQQQTAQNASKRFGERSVFVPVGS